MHEIKRLQWILYYALLESYWHWVLVRGLIREVVIEMCKNSKQVLNISNLIVTWRALTILIWWSDLKVWQQLQNNWLMFPCNKFQKASSRDWQLLECQIRFQAPYVRILVQHSQIDHFPNYTISIEIYLKRTLALTWCLAQSQSPHYFQTHKVIQFVARSDACFGN